LRQLLPTAIDLFPKILLGQFPFRTAVQITKEVFQEPAVKTLTLVLISI